MPQNGVDKYIKGFAVIPVFYYDGVMDCRHCSFIGTNHVLDSAYCKLTGTYIDKTNLKNKSEDCPVDPDTLK